MSAAHIDTHFDTLIIGAGISGICAAHHLNERCRGQRYAILEARTRVGGTWDLFQYPGIRSDSDMVTMGYPFRPWTRPEAISPGADIRAYIEDAARAEGIDAHIRFGHRVLAANWSTEAQRWTLEVAVGNAGDPAGERHVQYSCDFLFACSGYYRYEQGHTPDFPGQERFAGTIVHPQHWDPALDYGGKRVVVIGSGATAMTLVPALAQRAAQVTMLQRSPTYVVSMPAIDALAQRLHRLFPTRLAHRLARWKNTLAMAVSYRLVMRFPDAAKRRLVDMVRQQLGDTVDVARHFTPRYNPWEQRLCLVPDADLFKSLRSGRANVVTDTIEAFTETGIRLASGEALQADIIVTATGLELQLLGGVRVSVDGRVVDFARTRSFKGVMFSGVPNLASVFGYINASWTLKADLVAAYVARLRAYMARHDIAVVTPQAADDEKPAANFVEGFSAGYMQRALQQWPKQGERAPWRVNQNYFRDFFALRLSGLRHPALRFTPRATAAKHAARHDTVLAVQPAIGGG